jgi:hypothetical protein
MFESVSKCKGYGGHFASMLEVSATYETEEKIV